MRNKRQNNFKTALYKENLYRDTTQINKKKQKNATKQSRTALYKGFPMSEKIDIVV